ncbi:hypothetical protein LOK49_LG03G00802 [Camellia lanceoleosa]|uniref:Uncharacterized protein n=1 Tax=Camellia lanceoleosa TaxID=1840588 RepID=A0ACC0IEG1_9ERIC|nr:hypothetical protein LOK49_LG03G00802 [Camellia lanceoleosa]
MKRQRKKAMKASNKKAKGEEVVVVVEERREVRECVAAVEAEMLEDWEEWRWLWSRVEDDQISSWGSFWFPFWEIYWFGEDFNELLCTDVVWDDDIWDLKSIKDVPNP